MPANVQPIYLLQQRSLVHMPGISRHGCDFLANADQLLACAAKGYAKRLDQKPVQAPGSVQQTQRVGM